MTQIKVDTVTDAAGTAAPDFADGVTYEGAALSTLNTFEYYSTGTEPESANDGAIWWDTGNNKIFMFIADEWKEIDLGASAGGASWTVDLSNVTYDSVVLDVNSIDGSMNGLCFSADGTKMFTVGLTGDNLYQFSLSTAFDLSTASYDSVSIDVSAKETLPRGIFLSPDGTELYLVGTSSDTVHQYTLSTANDLSTASFTNSSISLASQTGNPYAICISPDGTKMYIGEFGGNVFQYSLSTAFDVTTVSYDSVSLSVGQNSIMGIDLNPDGTKLYVMSQASDVIYQYTLSTAFDISTASTDSSTFSLGNGDWADIEFSADGTKMYALTYSAADKIHQYSTGL